MIVADTDLQALRTSLAPHKIPLSARLTHGLGAGADPTIGRQAALAGREALSEALDGADLVIVLAGLGGGTGTGAAPVVSRLARGKGGLTAALVTTPFPCEGERRMAQADAGLRALDREVDLLITLTNHHVPKGRGEEPSLREAFRLREGGWRQAVHSLTEVLTALGLDDPDMPKVRTLMAGGWERAFLGSGTARGADRAVEAARHALSCPLSDETSLRAARGVLVAVAGGIDLTLLEVHEAACLIAGMAHEEAQILFSSAFTEHLQGELRVTVLASRV